ncbi:MAG: peptidoglycan-associated lipoprotein [Myxococcota bacterium]|jgi:peptidoglycan-associated lipoprotein
MTPRIIAVALMFATVGCKKTPPVTETPVITQTAEPTVASQTVPQDIVDLAQNFTRVYFDVDGSTLSDSAKSALNENITIMTRRPDIKLEIQGHADERGTTDYNLALGQRRAQSVYSFMKSSGIAQSRLKVVSYGEERPLRSASAESAWSQNRRCEFVITWSDNSAQGNVSGTTSE